MSELGNNDEHDVSAPNVDEVTISPLHSLSDDFRSALDEFRNNWHRELKEQRDGQQQQENVIEASTKPTSIDVEQQSIAESLFRKATELEQRGKVYDALPFYRKAVQIMPDIEFRFYERQKLKTANNMEPASRQSPNPNSNNISYAEEFIDNLYEKFQLDLARDYNGKLVLNNRDAGVISTEMHISDLPPEILLYILRWVISNQLDMKSLERCAAVCKGLYLCARDEELWRLSCVKVWGVNVGMLNSPIPTPSNEALAAPVYSTWRQMFIERERVLFNGCYISKTTYIRMGENSFQDQYYRPVQLVEYYRYIRFLPDGSVLMMTTADEPVQGVGRLKNLQQLRADVLRGRYHLFGNTVTILVTKQRQQRSMTNTAHQYQRQRRGSTAAAYTDEYSTTKYCIEFRINSTPKRRFVQLVWLHYSVVQTRNKVETSSEFDLVASKYPPLWFSPVRSYHLDTESPLA